MRNDQTASTGRNIRHDNLALVFGQLYPDRQLSKAELGRRTGLSRTAMSDLCGQLTQTGLICPVRPEQGHGRRGKRGLLLGIDPERLRIVVVDLSRSQELRACMTDLPGRPIAYASKALDVQGKIEPTDVTSIVQSMSGPDHDWAAPDGGRIVSVGVAVPGVVDRTGMVRDSVALDWHGVALRTMMEDTLGLPVSVDNDVTAAALCERHFGHSGPDTLFVRVEHGVGAAAFVSDRLLEGASCAAGEIGHISVDPAGPLCTCGKRGCLERLVSSPALSHALGGANSEEKVRILRQAGIWLGRALAPVVGMLDVADLCVQGDPAIVNNTFLTALQDYLDETAACAWRTRTLVRRSSHPADSSLRGESVAAVRRYMDSL